jgi:hypothetical protein
MRTGMGCNAVTSAIEDDHPPLDVTLTDRRRPGRRDYQNPNTCRRDRSVHWGCDVGSNHRWYLDVCVTGQESGILIQLTRTFPLRSPFVAAASARGPRTAVLSSPPPGIGRRPSPSRLSG